MARGISYRLAEPFAAAEAARLNCDIFIYRLKSGRFGVTSNRKTIPLTASIHNIISPAPTHPMRQQRVFESS